MNRIQYIVSQEALNQCVEVLKTKQKIALDLEFDKNRYRFGFNLCLAQLFDGDQVYLIDPLSKIDLEALFDVFEDKNIQKVVFSFDEDLRLLHSLNCFPKNIYDVHVAARLLNFPPISHTNLVKEILSIEPVNSAQNSNWYLRPLTEKQKIYAANDVLHLFDLQAHLEKVSLQKGIFEWILEENKALEKLDYSNEPSIVYKKEVDKKGLTEFQWFVFENLLDFREEIAQQYQKPSYQIIHKDDLKEIAIKPEKVNQWKNLKGVYKNLQNDVFSNQIKSYILNLVRQAEEMQLSKTNKVKTINLHLSNGISKSKREEIKIEKYDPIKQKIAKIYGENAAIFILPNKLALDLAGDNFHKLLNYKQKLFDSIK